MDHNPGRIAIDPASVFGRGVPLRLEIGFGSGEHLLHIASASPRAAFIGCEPFINGVASFLGKLRKASLTNIRIHPGDVRDVLDILPPGSLDRVYLPYPDPWPKRRHHRRRIVTAEYLHPLGDVMRSGAELRIATDVGDYARQAIEQLHAMPEFRWLADSPTDWRDPWSGWSSTRYERKAIKAGRRPIYLVFRRN